MGIPTLEIQGGKLGPITDFPEGGLNLRPFTLFIGKQGTGKSLVAQLSYFFENLPYLSKYVKARKGNDITPPKAVRSILDSLRSPRRAFAVFADPSLTICWRERADRERRCFRMDRRNRRVYTHRALKEDVAAFLKPEARFSPHGRALYLPAERVVYSHVTPTGWDLLSLPLTLRLFGEAMEQAALTMENWAQGIPDTEAGRWAYRKGKEILNGTAYRRGEQWKWRVRKDVQIDIDMASSGQKANWPAIALAQVLPSWRANNELEASFTLYIEEPETHLHPKAQVGMVHLLAYLVRQGFRVVLSTHSLTVLYALNNLLLASFLNEADGKGIPEPAIRLSPEQVSAYLFEETGTVRDLLDREARFITEVPLGEVGDRLGDEMNRILRAVQNREG